MRFPFIPNDESLPRVILPVTLPVVINLDAASIFKLEQMLFTPTRLNVPFTLVWVPFKTQSGVSPFIVMRTFSRVPFMGKCSAVL